MTEDTVVLTALAIVMGTCIAAIWTGIFVVIVATVKEMRR